MKGATETMENGILCSPAVIHDNVIVDWLPRGRKTICLRVRYSAILTSSVHFYFCSHANLSVIVGATFSDTLPSAKCNLNQQKWTSVDSPSASTFHSVRCGTHCSLCICSLEFCVHFEAFRFVERGTRTHTCSVVDVNLGRNATKANRKSCVREKKFCATAYFFECVCVCVCFYSTHIEFEPKNNNDWMERNAVLPFSSF